METVSRFSISCGILDSHEREVPYRGTEHVGLRETQASIGCLRISRTVLIQIIPRGVGTQSSATVSFTGVELETDDSCDVLSATSSAAMLATPKAGRRSR